MMRSSKRAALLLTVGVLGIAGSLFAAGPVPKSEPNFYAPTGYFASLAQELRVAAKMVARSPLFSSEIVISKQGIRRLHCVPRCKLPSVMQDVAG